MVAMSSMRGTFDSSSRSDVSRPATRSLSAEFLAPLIGISPCSGRPPRIRNRSIARALRHMRGVATPRWPMYLPALSA